VASVSLQISPCGYFPLPSFWSPSSRSSESVLVSVTGARELHPRFSHPAGASPSASSFTPASLTLTSGKGIPLSRNVWQ
jgi:hypothetical protein